MNYEEIKDKARGMISPWCKVCPECNGKACGNIVPGPGCKYPGNVAADNYDAWQKVKVNMDTLTSVKNPDISFEFFGKTFAAPIFVAPLGAITMHYGPEVKGDVQYNDVLVPACAEHGIMALTGDGVDPKVLVNAVNAMEKVDGIGCPTIKPWNKEFVFEKLDYVKSHNVFCVAMDIDGAGLPFLKAMNPNAGSKSVAELKEIVDYAEHPFIIKGIMTPGAALKAVEAGAHAIVVSNHGGRVQGGVPATADVLPAIAKAVNGKTKILVDGGIRSGVDVFRAIALGADGVLIGRPVLPVIVAEGSEGLKIYLDKIKGELISTMTMCGAQTLADINGDMIWN